MIDGIEWVETRERFLQIQAEWERLADTQDTPFVRHGWLAAWWEAFGESDLRTCTMWRDGDLVAAFPLRRCGRGLAALANVHSPLFRPFGRSDNDLEMVIGEVMARSGDLVVPALPTGHAASDLLVAAAERAGRRTLTTPLDASLIVETAGVEDYSSLLGAKTRRELGRLRRKMMREHEVTFSLVARPSNLEEELERGFEVEASGWKGARGTAILSSAATTSFYRLVARSFHAAGRLRISTISLDGRLAGFDLCLLDSGRLYGLKFGYDETFRNLGPGFVLQLGEIERCCELGIDAFELGADEEYKRRFSTGERRHFTFHSYAGTPVSLVRYEYRRRLRPLLKQAYQRLPGGRHHR